MKSLIVALSLVSSLSFAKVVPVHAEAFTYPSPAGVLLNILQAELAKKAIEACGIAKRVVSLDNIIIEVKAGVDGPVGHMNDGQLSFFYPKMTATTLATCED